MRLALAKKPVVLLALSLVAVGCAKSSAPSSSRSLTIVSPKDGATVASPVRLVLAAKGVQIGPPETGKMHFHVHVDGSSQYAVVTTTQPSLSLPAGQHTLKVVLAQPNHDETSTSASVTITVSQGGATSSPSGYGY